MNPSFPHHVCKLQKVIYCLSRLSDKLIQLGFVGSKADSSLFIYRTQTITMFLLIYVNDIIITASDQSAITELLQLLNVILLSKIWEIFIISLVSKL